MLASVFAFPAFLAFFLWLLPWLEERTLTPEERAEKIERLLNEETPDEIERRVAELLAHSIADHDRARSRSVESASAAG